MDAGTLWERALTEIELEISGANFTTWFGNTSISRISNGTVTIRVPSMFVKEWLQTKFHNQILKTLRGISSDIRAVNYSVSKNAQVQAQKFRQGRAEQRSQESSSNTTFKDNNSNETESLRLPDKRGQDGLNSRYTFENLIIGPFNELAYAAAQAVIKKPGEVYNPLFIYGNTGHGKTHLIQAIGNKLKSLYDGLSVLYMTSERFSTELVSSFQSGSTNKLKNKYRSYDVLIMDDIQFIANKEKSQEELFHLFNSLYDDNRQIIFSSDKHPQYINGLEDRLRSRFGAGMVVDIPSPDFESRVAILTSKAERLGIEIAKEVVEYLANIITTNVRELEGALNGVSIKADLINRSLTLEEVKELIDTSPFFKKQTSPDEVITIVADYYNLTREIILEKSRKKELIIPRQLTMYILREDYAMSYPSIGDRVGGRDHTTVMHSCEKINKHLKEDKKLATDLNEIRSIIAH